MALPAQTYIFFLCQSINLTAAVISVTVSALIGSQIAPSASLATVPYGAQFAAVTLLTYPASVFMRCFGRKAGFYAGAFALIAAGGVGYVAVTLSSFPMLVFAHALLGAFIACANFYRFAAVDNVALPLRAKAISLVVAGGVVASITGPALSVSLQNIAGFTNFSLCYAVLSALGMLTIILVSFLKGTEPHTINTAVANAKLKNPLTTPVILAIYVTSVGYFVMNLLMVQSSLVMHSSGVEFTASTFAVQAHVVAMFAPSFIMGRFITKMGMKYSLLAGFLLLIFSSIIGMVASEYSAMVASLIILGIGWNVTYIGGAAFLAQHLTDGNRYRLQGINDTVIAVFATIGAVSPAFLHANLGWAKTNFLCLALCVTGSIFVLAVIRKA